MMSELLKYTAFLILFCSLFHADKVFHFVQPEMIKQSGELQDNRITDKLPSDTATISFQGAGVKGATFHYYDYLENLSQVQLKPNGNSIKIVFEDIVILHLTGRENTPFILMPGDNVKFSNGPLGELVCETNDTVRANEILVFNEMVEKFGPVTGPFSRQFASTEPDVVKLNTLLETKLAKELSFLETYSKLHPMRDEVKILSQEFLEHNYYFSLAESLLLFHPGLNIAHPVLNNARQYLKRQRASAYNFPDFRKAAYLFLYILNRSYTPQERFDRLYAMAGDYFHESYVAAFHFYLLKSSTYQKLKNYEHYFQSYISAYPDNYFAKFLLKEATTKVIASKKSEETRLLLLDNTTVSLDEMIAAKKGKVVYIDFWASWCEPCLREMPHLLKLREEYKESNIEFVDISMDMNTQSWQNGMRRLPGAFNTANTYMMLDNFSSPFAQLNDIQFIPRYMLINKEGKLIDMNALSPSDPKLVKQLVELANE